MKTKDFLKLYLPIDQSTIQNLLVSEDHRLEIVATSFPVTRSHNDQKKMKSKICDICVSSLQTVFTFISFCGKIMHEYERFPGTRPAMSRMIVYRHFRLGSFEGHFQFQILELILTTVIFIDSPFKSFTFGGRLR